MTSRNDHLEGLNEEVRQLNIERVRQEEKDPAKLDERIQTINALYDEIRDRIQQGCYGQALEPVFYIKCPAPHAPGTPS